MAIIIALMVFVTYLYTIFLVDLPYCWAFGTVSSESDLKKPYHCCLRKSSFSNCS